jgi:hypothetical protein
MIPDFWGPAGLVANDDRVRPDRHALHDACARADPTVRADHHAGRMVEDETRSNVGLVGEVAPRKYVIELLQNRSAQRQAPTDGLAEPEQSNGREPNGRNVPRQRPHKFVGPWAL